MTDQPTEQNSPIHNLLKDTQPLTPSINRRRFLQSTSLATVAGASMMLAGCNNDNDDNDNTAQVSFLHGVASGDPLADKVILWTRVTPVSSGSSLDVDWQIASDNTFNTIIHKGTSKTNGGQDYTVKVDATGLQPNTSYFYRFICGGVTSPIGKTKTLPVTNVNQVKLAVVSCSNYPAGYFHAYADIAKRSDVDVLLHLGDYIYEYGRHTIDDQGKTVPAYASSQAAQLNREVIPVEELLTITGYRLRYAQYRTDKDLQAVHAAMPMIAVWDDHEISNDTYKAGAENHQPNEGDWNQRKMDAMKAYHEWMPTRNSVMTQIYRSFDFGNLLSLHMLDTRVIARDKQLDYNNFLIKDANGQLTLDGAKFTAAMQDTSRQLLGLPQQNWLAGQLQASKSTWQILGQQVVMGQMFIPAPVLLNFMNPALGVDAITYLTLMQKAQTAPTTLTPQEQSMVQQLQQAPFIPYNLDAWDGYAVAREMVYGIANAMQKNLVVLAGDTHNAWANNLVNVKGEPVGVEFAVQSVTSPGFEEYLATVDPKQLSLGLPMLVKGGTLKWCDTSQRGYMIVTVTPEQCTSDWVFVSDITKPTYSSSVGKTMRIKVGEPYLV